MPVSFLIFTSGVADLVDDGGLDALGRLVEDQELGLGEHGAGDGELLLLAAAEDAAFARRAFRSGPGKGR